MHRDAVRVGLLVVAALAAWELGQVVATYLLLGIFGGTQPLGLWAGNGFDQAETLALLVARVAVAALLALLCVLPLARLLWRDRR